ncbi:MAG: UDP-glucose/GDP-mannose dehydrogenase family protein [Actinomycetales bacterium]|nr:UDP-glucose/GDP-mannose dehydrogenase family protein [Actinomycetales bacterium]
MKLSVIGTGYLGATHAVCMAELGYEVVGVDLAEHRIAQLAAGQLPFFEPGLPELLTRNLAEGRLTFTTDMAAAADAAVHFLCVGTPEGADGSADLRYVDAAVAALAAVARGTSVLAGKSTVPVGTADALAARLAAHTTSAQIEVVWNPEFLREGFAVADTLRPDRIVVGTASAAGEAALREVYAPLLSDGVPFLVTDRSTAELVKVAANSFLATKISFINAMAEICEATGSDVVHLAEALGYDTRIGNRFLQAGIGFGGGCLPKDIRAFQAAARGLGLPTSVDFLRSVDEINTRRRDRVTELAGDLLGGLGGRAITVLGAAFKPDSDDVRDSPALAISRALHAAGAVVTVHDPQALANAQQAAPELHYATDIRTAFAGAELVAHLTEWHEYRTLNPVAIADVVAARLMIDGRNVLDRGRWAAAGWTVHSLGRPAVHPQSG